MIDPQKLKATVETTLQGTDAFITGITVSPDNIIDVEIDADTSVDIDTCVAVNRAIEAAFSRDDEDYELRVGSAGITTPLKVARQYVKNIGHELEVLTADGRKVRGELTEVSPDGTAFTLAVARKIKPEGKKRPELVVQPERFEVAMTRSVTPVLNFK